MKWWTLINGEIKYRSGRRALVAEQQRRARCCAACDLRQDFREDELREKHPEIATLFERAPLSSWCGEPGEPDPEKGTCGCPVLAQSPKGKRIDVTVKGEPMRAVRKAELKKSTCPRWAKDGGTGP